jgi:hypothetical protein
MSAKKPSSLIRQHGCAFLAGGAQDPYLARFRERDACCHGREPDLDPVREYVGDRVAGAFIGDQRNVYSRAALSPPPP